MTTATYTLTKNGLAKGNDTVINGEWWSRSPVEVPNVGLAYEARATLIDNTGATLTGIFDNWLVIANDLSWSAESVGASTTNIKIEVREGSTKDVTGSATITLEN